MRPKTPAGDAADQIARMIDDLIRRSSGSARENIINVRDSFLDEFGGFRLAQEPARLKFLMDLVAQAPGMQAATLARALRIDPKQLHKQVATLRLRGELPFPKRKNSPYTDEQLRAALNEALYRPRITMKEIARRHNMNLHSLEDMVKTYRKTLGMGPRKSAYPIPSATRQHLLDQIIGAEFPNGQGDRSKVRQVAVRLGIEPRELWARLVELRKEDLVSRHHDAAT